jgi:hypothetical protein
VAWPDNTNTIILAHLVNIVSMAILVAFNIYYFEIAMSSILWGWGNDILRHCKEERVIF